jgi:hypothetical protein
MKATLAVKFSSLVVLSLAAILLAGCATMQTVDWNSRVGRYTYNQAVNELGPPDQQIPSSDGKVVAKWVIQRYSGPSYNVGTGYFGNHTGFAASHNFGPAYKSRFLQLTFGTDGLLTAWSKNY